MAKRWWVSLVYLVLAALALSNAGCLALAIGGAAGGAAAGYALYVRGQFYRDYPASLDDSTAAVRTALSELQFPLVNEKREGDEIIFESRTGDGEKIRIQVSTVVSRVPADGATTHIAVRVGSFGDEKLSTRLLDQISLHLVAPVLIRPTASNPAPVPNASGWLPEKPRETTAPPLAK